METPDSILIGAVRWLVELQFREVGPARLSLKTTPRYRDLTPTQYESAMEWLIDRHLVTQFGVVCEPSLDPAAQVLQTEIAKSPPPWLADADSLIRTPEDLPLDVLQLGELLDMNETNIFEEVGRAWKKFDDLAQRELGAAGESALIAWLEERSVADVIHVSSFDDTAGYDIALAVSGIQRARIEVKATRRLDSVVVYLSRNEFETMRRHSTWCLQVVILDPSGRIRSTGWLPPLNLIEWAPKDGSMGRWQSMKLVLPTSSLRTGAAPPILALLSHV